MNKDIVHYVYVTASKYPTKQTYSNFRGSVSHIFTAATKLPCCLHWLSSIAMVEQYSDTGSFWLYWTQSVYI